MSKNKRAPKELAKYVVAVKELVNNKQGVIETFKYFSTQKEAKAWAKRQAGRVRLYRIDYDFYGEL